MLLFIVHLGHEEAEIIKGCTWAYLTLAQYDNFSDVEEANQESKIGNLSDASSETKGEILLVIPSNSKMIFPDDHISVRKVLLQDAKISVEMQDIECSNTCCSKILCLHHEMI